MTYGRKARGLTLIEMVIVVTILAILILISMMSWKNQLDKARDARKKADLQRLSIAFEEYFSDWNCYPAADILQNCGGNQLGAYLDKIPCDPVTKRPYCYVTDSANQTCFKNFRILTPLKSADDPAIPGLGCYVTDPYCGWEPECADLPNLISGFNYGVSSKNVTVSNPTLPSPSPSPAPSPPAGGSASPQPSASPTGNLACDPTGQCNVYDNPAAAGCPVTWFDPIVCQAACDESSSYWCNQ